MNRLWVSDSESASGSQPEPGSSTQQEIEIEPNLEPDLELKEILRQVEIEAQCSALLEASKEYHQARNAELERQLDWQKWNGLDISAERERRKAALNHQSELLRKLRVIAGGK